MIRRLKRIQGTTDSGKRILLGNGHFEDGLPVTSVNSAPNSNGYFHNALSTGSQQKDRYRRREGRRTSISNHKYYVSRIWVLVFGGFLGCFWISYHKLSIYSRSKQTRRRTPSVFIIASENHTTYSQNYTIVLPSSRFQPASRKLALLKSPLSTVEYTHDFGKLKLRFPEYGEIQEQERVIYHDEHEDVGYNRLWNDADDDGHMESYYAFDDDDKRNPLVMYDDADVHLRKKCRRTNWHRDLPIACNAMHDFDFQSRFKTGEAKYLGHGYYRTVYVTSTPQNESVVVKMLNWNYNFTYDDFEFMRMDAIINEKLNGNPEIVNSYAFCGNSIMGESMELGDLHNIAIPSGTGRDIKFINDEDNLFVQNSLSGTKKLELSLQMAEAVLLLHSYPGGVIVHDDIHLSQFLISENGKLKLNDFNRAEIMLWNEKDQEYCKYRNYPGWGDWRAPEEYHDKPLDEKIDIWSLGNNMYSLLTGVYPFCELTEEETQENVKKGMTAYIDPRYYNRSFAESKIVEIIPQCWIYDPQLRIDIFNLVDFLRNAVRDNTANKK